MAVDERFEPHALRGYVIGTSRLGCSRGCFCPRAAALTSVPRGGETARPAGERQRRRECRRGDIAGVNCAGRGLLLPPGRLQRGCKHRMRACGELGGLELPGLRALLLLWRATSAVPVSPNRRSPARQHRKLHSVGVAPNDAGAGPQFLGARGVTRRRAWFGREYRTGRVSAIPFRGAISTPLGALCWLARPG